MTTLNFIDTTAKYAEILAPVIEKEKLTAKFLNSTSPYSIQRADEFEKNDFKYTKEMEEYQDRVHKLMFHDFFNY